jgi:hypothetical protein
MSGKSKIHGELHGDKMDLLDLHLEILVVFAQMVESLYNDPLIVNKNLYH